MKTRFLAPLVLVGILLALYLVHAGRILEPLRQSVSAVSLEARQSLAKRAIYPFSLVPGGTLTAAELRTRPDKYARKFYGDLNYQTAQTWRSYGEAHYNSYRVGNHIYQKTTLSRTRVGELLIKVQRRSGKFVFIRARCGNLLLDSISEPVQEKSKQPDDVVLGSASEKTNPPGSSPPVLSAYGPHFEPVVLPTAPVSIAALVPPVAEMAPEGISVADMPTPTSDFGGGGLAGSSGGAGGPLTSRNNQKASAAALPAFLPTPLAHAQTSLVPVAPIPEPASWTMLLLAIALCVLFGNQGLKATRRFKGAEKSR